MIKVSIFSFPIFGNLLQSLKECQRDHNGFLRGINDAGWSQLRKWIEYFGIKYGRLTIAVNPAYTSQECLNCGRLIQKSLSVRTHVCSCGYVEDRDKMAALNILKKATIGHIGSWSLDLNAWGDFSVISKQLSVISGGEGRKKLFVHSTSTLSLFQQLHGVFKQAF